MMLSEMDLLSRIMDLTDPSMLMVQDDEDRPQANSAMRTKECLISTARIGLLCSKQSPEKRIKMSEVANELRAIRNVYGGGRHS